MCLLVLAHRARPDYPLVLLANRDEYYDRPTAPARFWQEAPHVLAGRDLKAGGTWLGMDTRGRFAAITNYRDPGSYKSAAPSRGALVSDYLLCDMPPETYIDRVSTKASEYNGFNLVVGDLSRIFWFSNRDGAVVELSPGVHGLSNHLLNTPWPKVEKAKKGLAELLAQDPLPQEERFLALLADTTPAPDHLLPDTGVGLEWERILSPIFIKSPNYGTRSSTIIVVDKEGKVTFVEKTHVPKTKVKRFSWESKPLTRVAQ